VGPRVGLDVVAKREQFHPRVIKPPPQAGASRKAGFRVSGLFKSRPYSLMVPSHWHLWIAVGILLVWKRELLILMAVGSNGMNIQAVCLLYSRYRIHEFWDSVKVKVKLSLCFFLTEHHAVKAYLADWRYSSMHSLTSTLDGGEWSASRPGRFNPRERAPDTHRIGGWVGPRAGNRTL
jgi:hypothetical protein